MGPLIAQGVLYNFVSALAVIGGAALLAVVVLGTAAEFLMARKGLRIRYRLRTLLIVLALGPIALAGAWWLCRRTIPDTFVHDTYIGPQAITP